jgi:hypothetical protein
MSERLSNRWGVLLLLSSLRAKDRENLIPQEQKIDEVWRLNERGIWIAISILKQGVEIVTTVVL